MKRLLLKKYLYLLSSIFFFFHGIRDLSQFLWIENFLTKIGGHELGVNGFNYVMRPFGIQYQRSYELLFFIVEVVVTTVFFKVYKQFKEQHLLAKLQKRFFK